MLIYHRLVCHPTWPSKSDSGCCHIFGRKKICCFHAKKIVGIGAFAPNLAGHRKRWPSFWLARKPSHPIWEMLEVMFSCFRKISAHHPAVIFCLKTKTHWKTFAISKTTWWNFKVQMFNIKQWRFWLLIVRWFLVVWCLMTLTLTQYHGIL